MTQLHHVHLRPRSSPSSAALSVESRTLKCGREDSLDAWSAGGRGSLERRRADPSQEKKKTLFNEEKTSSTEETGEDEDPRGKNTSEEAVKEEEEVELESSLLAPERKKEGKAALGEGVKRPSRRG